MATRAQTLVPIFIAAVIIGVVGLSTIPSDSKLESVEFPRGTIIVDGITLEVQIADTQSRRVRGLMFQEQLPASQGMVFVFEQRDVHSLWMLNMQFALDMIWFDKDGSIVHIEENVPPCKTALEITTCQNVIPDNESDYVLEVTSGFVSQNNITKNSSVKIISI